MGNYQRLLEIPASELDLAIAAEVTAVNASRYLSQIAVHDPVSTTELYDMAPAKRYTLLEICKTIEGKE